jgi:hypothetical protein
MNEAPKPHWSVPHVIGVLLAVAVYIVLFALTGESELFVALATGAVGILGSWLYLFSGIGRRNK